MQKDELARMAGAMIIRAGQIRAKIILAVVIAIGFHTIAGAIFSGSWLSAYVVLQLVEKWRFPPKTMAKRLAARGGATHVMTLVIMNNLLFSSFGVAEIAGGGPWGAVCGSLLITGTMVNGLLTCAASRPLFLATIVPQIICFTALPVVGVLTYSGAITVTQLSIAAALNITATAMAWRVFLGTLNAGDLARREAEAANIAKSAFLASMSHEIRTPLNGVLGMAQAMAVDDLPQVQRERLEVIRQSGQALLSILDDILDLSKIEAGKLEIEEMEFDLGSILRSVEATFSPLAEKKGLALHLDIEAGEGVYQGDPARLRQIVFNLVGNALKFTQAGSVSLTAAHDAEMVRISVIDTGIGINQSELARIFEKFEQADASTTRRFGGSGLGLAICRDLAGLMGGTIEAFSQPGAGATFTACLPMARISDVSLNDETAPDEESSDFTLSGLRLLAAEDNKINQLVIKTLLAQIGIEPAIACDGEEVIDIWRQGEFDLILMDVQMPTLDGVAATRAIRCEEAATGRRRTYIVALTANAMAHQVQDYRDAGMDAYVAKPIQAAKLFDALVEASDYVNAQTVDATRNSGTSPVLDAKSSSKW